MDFVSSAKLFCGKPGLVFMLCFFTYFFALANAQMFSINPPVFEERFDLTDLDIRLFLIYPSITCILFLWPVLKAIREDRIQARYWLIVFSGFNAFGSILRMIPLYTNNHTTWIFHVAHLIIPIGIFSNALAAQISAVWFPPEYRGLTTSFIIIAGVLGASTLKIIGATITTNTNNASRMFYVEATAAVALFVLVLWLCPMNPSKSKPGRESGEYEKLEGAVTYNWNKGVLLTVASITLLRGVKSPVFSNMTALVAFDDIANQEAAYISAIQGWTLICGAIILGYIMSFNRLRAERRVLLILVIFLYGCMSAWFSLSFASVFWHTTPISYTYSNSILTQAFAGTIWGIIRPLTHEYVAELSYPTPPLYFGVWMELGKNCVGLCVLLIPSRIAYKFIFELLTLVTVISALMISCTPPRLLKDLENFNEDRGYGSSVYCNRAGEKLPLLTQVK